jgi:hypothetical protein
MVSVSNILTRLSRVQWIYEVTNLKAYSHLKTSKRIVSQQNEILVSL